MAYVKATQPEQPVKHENNYELANSLNELFEGEKMKVSLPNKELNSCLNCKNATWYSTGYYSVSANCSLLNVIVFKTNLMDEGKPFEGITVCSKNPTFKPE